MALTAVGRTLVLAAPEYPFQWALPFVGITQYGNSLCWAACVESTVASRLGSTTVVQSQLARRFIPACNRSLERRRIRDSRCDKPLTVDHMVSVWRYAGFPDAEQRAIPTNLGRLFINELVNDRPVQAWIDRYHSVMVYGYKRKADGKEKVLIMDPQAGFGDGWRALGVRSRWSAVWVGLNYEELENA